VSTCLLGLEAELAVAALSREGKPVPAEPCVRALYRTASRQLTHLESGHCDMFLANGARFYVDGGHPEYATPECSHPTTAVAHLRAGERLVAEMAEAMRKEEGLDSVSIFRNNVDYGSLSTWGIHESYCARLSPTTRYAPHLIPHLTSRIIYSGSGGIDPHSAGIRFSLSPRTAFLHHAVSESSTSDRAIFHTKNEPLSGGYSRVHVICGDNSCSELATYLKVGTTALIIKLIDEGVNFAAHFTIANPVNLIHQIATSFYRGPEDRPARRKHRAPTAIDIQRTYLGVVEEYCGKDGVLPAWAPQVCAQWRDVLDRLEREDPTLALSLDWNLKNQLFTQHITRRGFSWQTVSSFSDALDALTRKLKDQSGRTTVDVEFLRRHQKQDEAKTLLADRGLALSDLKRFNSLRDELCEMDVRFGEVTSGIFADLDRQGVLRHRVTQDADLDRAVREPPADTRAHARGRWVQRLASNGDHYLCNWNQIRSATEILDLSDPFATERDQWHQTPSTLDLVDRVDHVAIRQLAFEHYRDGRFVEAEELLNGLLASGFEPADIRCHLARVCLITDRLEEARANLYSAWEGRSSAQGYVWARILCLKVMLACVASDSGDMMSTEIPRLLGQLKAVFASRGGATLEWTMQPVLNHFASLLTAEQNALLAALIKGASAGDYQALEAFDIWRRQKALPLGAAPSAEVA